jgi:hypothetical protein
MKFTYAAGDQPLDGYTIKQGLGRGGFGEVYRGVSSGGKEVALKLVQRNLDVEIRGVGQCLNLKHPNLIGLYDVKQGANGDCWVIMEYVGGDTLDKVIARHQQGMPQEEVVAWLRGIGEGIGHLHERGIVHRDLKPGNIFREDGVVKIGDYGLSKFVSTSRRSGQTGSVGTVHYMAPEVVRGRYGKEVDLYAIGIVLYEMLTGRVPFDGESPGEILMKHLTSRPDISVLPPAFRPVVSRLLEKDPSRRYSSFQAMLADLNGYLASPPQTGDWQPEFQAAVHQTEQPVVESNRFIPAELAALAHKGSRFFSLIFCVALAAIFSLGLGFVSYAVIESLHTKTRVGVRATPFGPVFDQEPAVTELAAVGIAFLAFGVFTSLFLFVRWIGQKRHVRGRLADAFVRQGEASRRGSFFARVGPAIVMGLGVGLLVGGIVGSKSSHSDTGVAVGFGSGLLACAITMLNSRREAKLPWHLSNTGAPPPPISSPGVTGKWQPQPGCAPGEREASVP